jgi:predicted transposase YdaD
MQLMGMPRRGSEVCVNTTKPWDDSMKLLVRQDPQSLVSFLVPDAVFEGMEDRELQAAPSVTSDTLYRITWQGKQVILHVEFQLKHDPEMGERLWHYNALTHIHTKLPVYSVVIYLLEDKPLVESPYVIWLPNGQPTQRLDFETMKLWEVPPEAIEQPGLLGLLPLLPLTKGGKNRETVLRMIDKLKEKGTRDLIVVGYACSCLVFTVEDELKWLKGEFFKMQDILKDTWVFQEIGKEARKEGLEEGREEELCNILIRITTLRFPDLVSQAQKQAEQAKSPEQLRTMIDRLVTASTDQEARDALMS